MTVSKMLVASVMALTLVPAAAQAAGASRAPSISAPAQSLSLSHATRVGAQSGKGSHILGLGLLASLLIAAGAVAAAVVVGDAVSNNSSG